MDALVSFIFCVASPNMTKKYVAATSENVRSANSFRSLDVPKNNLSLSFLSPADLVPSSAEVEFTTTSPHRTAQQPRSPPAGGRNFSTRRREPAPPRRGLLYVSLPDAPVSTCFHSYFIRKPPISSRQPNLPSQLATPVCAPLWKQEKSTR